METLRDACDDCHRRKIRCISRGRGACANCWDADQVCIYSPRNPMGRPALQQRKTRQQGRKRRQDKSANTPSSRQEPNLPDKAAATTAQQQQQQQQQQHHTAVAQPQTKVFHKHVGQESLFGSASEPAEGSGEDSTLLHAGANGESTFLVSMTHNMEPMQGGNNVSTSESMSSYMASLFSENYGFAPEAHSENKEHSSHEAQRPELVFDPHMLAVTAPDDPSAPGTMFMPTSDAVEQMDKDDLFMQHMTLSFSAARMLTSQPSTPALMECYSQLSHILFGLHSSRERLENSPINPADAQRDSWTRQVFETVGMFCDLVLPIFGDMHTFVEEPRYSAYLLVVSVTNAIVDLYQLLLDRHRSAWSPRPSSSSGSSTRESSYGVDWPVQQNSVGTQTLLTLILYARTMDFHLQQLERLFYSITVMEGAQQTQLKITTLREALQVAIDGLESYY